MGSIIDFWFDFASSYSYPAAMRAEPLAKAAGVALNWRPYLLGPIFVAQGWSNSPFNLYPRKGRYMRRDIERIDEAATLAAILASLRLPDDALARATGDPIKQALRVETDEAQRLDLFGAPSFVTHDGELFWGNDRLEDALAWAANH